MKTTKLNWIKIPSVTTGGKPFFYRAYADGTWQASIVWNRVVLAYAVTVANPDRLVGYISTVSAGKQIAVNALAGPLQR